MTVDERDRWPDDRCEPSVVANESCEGYLPSIDMHDYVAGQEPRGGLDPHPVLATRGDLPPKHAIWRRSQLQTKAEKDTLGKWNEEEQSARYSPQCRLEQLLGCSAWRLLARGGHYVGVIGVRKRAKRAHRLGNLPPPPHNRGACKSVATRSARTGVLGRGGGHNRYYTYVHVRNKSELEIPASTASRRSTQAERSARSRSALLESAARGLSRYGYGNLVLEEVARGAGYTRGALYHQFKDKEDLALAVIEWVNENWMREVGDVAARQTDPVAELLTLARGHAVFCRRDIARVVMALRLEFSGQDHRVGREIERIWETGVRRFMRLIKAGRRAGSIPPGPPARAMAMALLGALEGAVIALPGQAPHDELLAARVVVGVLGLHPTAEVTDAA